MSIASKKPTEHPLQTYFYKVEQVYLRYEYLPFFWNTLLKDIHTLVTQISRKYFIKIQEIYPTFCQTICSISCKNASYLFQRYAKFDFIIQKFQIISLSHMKYRWFKLYGHFPKTKNNYFRLMGYYKSENFTLAYLVIASKQPPELPLQTYFSQS